MPEFDFKGKKFNNPVELSLRYYRWEMENTNNLETEG